jgi:hypothetical protein
MSLIIILNIAFIVLASAGVLITLLDLPGNLIILVLAVLYGVLDGFVHISVWELVILGAVFLGGELAEIGMGALLAGRERASRRAKIFAFIGAILGGVLGTVVLPLAGSIIGVLAGCFGGAYFAELNVTGSRFQALRVAKCVLKGQIFGIIIKCTVGIGMAMYVVLSMAWQ